MSWCEKCGKIIDNDKGLCFDCFKEDFNETEKLIDEDKRKNRGFLLKSIIGLLNAISLLIKTFVILIILGALFAYFFIPSFNGDLKNPEEKISLNFAATVTLSVGTYYSNTQDSGFVGLKTDFGQPVEYVFDKYPDHYKIDVKGIDDYKCEILDSIVVVTHKGGTKAEVRWR